MSKRPQLLTDIAAVPDGILLAPVSGRGPWTALRELHGAMAGLRREGLTPELTFVHAIATDGRIVPGRHPEAAVFVLGYRYPQTVTV
jgi:hypothetical protein